MAVISLNTNLSSLQTQRRLSETSSVLSKSFERLSSGLRVSRACDDAAGLAVASALSVDARVFSQGLRNLSDGVSVTNIAEGALDELTNIVLRLQELAEQASNGTLGLKQRSALDAEAQALSEEYFRIAQTTEFNGNKLLDGSLNGLFIQAGYGQSGGLQASLGGRLGTGSFNVAADAGTAAQSAKLGDLNGDGALDLVTRDFASNKLFVLLGNGDGSFKAQTTVQSTSPAALCLGDMNGDGSLDIVTANLGANSAFVHLGNGDGSFSGPSNYAAGTFARDLTLGDVNSDGALDIVCVTMDANPVSVLLGNGDGTFRAKKVTGSLSLPYSAALGDLNRDGVLDLVTTNNGDNTVAALLGNGDGTFQTKKVFATEFFPERSSLGDLNGDGILDIVTANSTALSVFLGHGDGTFQSRTVHSPGAGIMAVELGDLNGDGNLDIVSDTSTSGQILLGNGNGTFAASTVFEAGNNLNSIELGDLNRDGVFDIAAANSTSGNVSVLIAATRDGVAPLLTFSLKTKAESKWALELMKQKLSQLSQQRGIIGANQSRLSTAVANLQVERENYVGASSQITDVDVASESSQLLKAQMLQQAASAVLSQANQAPALALKLLSG